MDREKVLTHGREAAGKLLVELQVRKSTADGAGARAFYTELTTPLLGWEGEIRDLVLKKKQVNCITICHSNVLLISHYIATQALRAAEHLHRQRRSRT